MNFYSIGYMRCNNESEQTGYFAAFAICMSAVMGIAMAENLLTFFIFYELLTLASYPLVLHKRNQEALMASRKYLIYTLISGQLSWPALSPFTASAVRWTLLPAVS